MHTPTHSISLSFFFFFFVLFTLLNPILLATAAPIHAKPNPLTSRQLENFSSSDDSGALYDLGTPVTGTDAWRDDNGVYHDWKRDDGIAKRDDEAQVEGVVPVVKREVGGEVSADAATAPEAMVKALDKGEKVYF